jgi:hypothetical protein
VSTLTLNVKAMYDYIVGKSSEQDAIKQAVVDTLRHPAFRIEVVPPQAFSSLQPVGDALAAAHAEITQLKFLLASAPMLDAPSKLDGANWFKRTATPFGYIHPITMAQYYLGSPTDHRHGVITIPGSNTRWVMTSLMPEDRVLLSPFPMPGIERILAR